MKQVLGNGYKENDYYSGYLTIYKSDGESDVYTFSRQESNILCDAIKQDVKEGNFDYYQLPAVYKGWTGRDVYQFIFDFLLWKRK